MNKIVNIAIVGLGQVGIYLYNELRLKKKEIEIKNKMKIEFFWNRVILERYSDQVKIDKEKLLEKKMNKINNARKIYFGNVINQSCSESTSNRLKKILSSKIF